MTLNLEQPTPMENSPPTPTPTPTDLARLNTLGIDVSKAKLDCALLRQNAPGKRLDKSVANTPAGIHALLAWLDSKGCPAQAIRAVLEPAGVCHETATWLLHEAGCTVVLVNPARLRSYAGAIGVVSKNDQIDAALLARRDTLCADIQRDGNRLEKARCAMNTPKVVIGSINKTLKFLEKELIALDAQIKIHIDDDPTLKNNDTLLQSIKGVGPRVAQRMKPCSAAKASRVLRQWPPSSA
ncbi:MAG: transposase [Rhizobacter sp.]|nr:transposase [Burkholderiales bacterium]